MSFACPVHRGDTGGAFKRTQRVRETRNQRWKMIWKALIGVFVYRSAVGASLSVPWESLTRICPPKFSPVSLLCVWRFGGHPLHPGTRLPTAPSVLPRQSGLHGTAQAQSSLTTTTGRLVRNSVIAPGSADDCLTSALMGQFRAIFRKHGTTAAVSLAPLTKEQVADFGCPQLSPL